jgi:hypothetical protein
VGDIGGALLSFGLAIYTYKVSGTPDSMGVTFAAMFGFISSVSALRHFWHRNDKEDEEVARD